MSLTIEERLRDYRIAHESVAKDNERLEADIARLRSDLTVEKINNKRLQSERNNAEAEIARLRADYLEAAECSAGLLNQIEKLTAALEEIRRTDWRFANDGTIKIYGKCSSIARKALAKEGK